MIEESCSARLRDIVFRSVTAQGDAADPRLHRLQPAHERKAVSIRQPDVRDHEVEALPLGKRESLFNRAGGKYLEAAPNQQPPKGVSGGDVVFDDEKPPAKVE